MIKYHKTTLLLLLGILMTGCADLTQPGASPLEKSINPDKQVYPQKGRVYTMRGLLGIFSLGMNELSERVDKEVGVYSMSVSDTEWERLSKFIIQERKAGKLESPLILVGHSYGADDQIRVADKLNKAGIPVDLLITVDPTISGPVPPNVKHAFNIYKSFVLTDSMAGMPGKVITAENPTKTTITNFNLKDKNVGIINHFNMDDSTKVQDIIIAQIRKEIADDKNNNDDDEIEDSLS